MEQLFKGQQRRQRAVKTKLPIWVGTENRMEQLWTEEVSASGLRMHIPDERYFSDAKKNNRDVELRIGLNGDEEPARVVAEFLWSVRQNTGDEVACLLFRGYYQDARERLVDFVRRPVNYV